MKILKEFNNFLSIEKEYSSLENSNVAILSAPLEMTVSYGKGCSRGPEKIIEASAYVEFYDNETNREICFEQGIVSLEPLCYDSMSIEEALASTEKITKQLLERSKFVVLLGGEHTVSIAPIKAHLEKYPKMSLLQFDAHSDLREEYEDSPYSHACAMKRVVEFLNPSKLTQVGIRALSKEESIFIKENKINTFFATDIRTGKWGLNWQKELVSTLSDEIYISFDIDYFDPSLIPSTGTPEPDGFFYNETVEIFREIKRQNKKIVGFDLVELAPIKGLSHPNLTAARLIYKILNFVFS
ncbi:MAG: agmatinase [Ignavibacteria bacterium]|nr:agmatinase [Ignavibacteria bacterium]